MKKFRIIFNPSKAWAVGIARKAESLLKSRGQAVVSEKEDVCVIIGGDGTIFYNKNEIQGAVLGVGGMKSKVCQTNSGNWKTMLEKVLKAKNIPEEERTALSVKINGKYAGWAINDAVVHARRHNFVEITMKIRKNSYAFGGDGVIVATPTGASGYAYSAGGFTIDKSNYLVEVVGICPYMRSFTPKLAPVASEIEILCKGAADLVLDGQQIIELGENDNINICGNRTVKFVEV